MRRDWLSLEISSNTQVRTNAKKPSLLLSIPKKVVRLSTRRNRIKRLIREVTRKDVFFADTGKQYRFKVRSAPGVLTLEDVRVAIDRIKSQGVDH